MRAFDEGGGVLYILTVSIKNLLPIRGSFLAVFEHRFLLLSTGKYLIFMVAVKISKLVS